MKCCLCGQDSVVNLTAPVALDVVPSSEPASLEFEMYCKKFSVCEPHFATVRDMTPRERLNLFLILKMGATDSEVTRN
jgi:hypothetical protein